ncbi:MAG: aminotransferase class I/II-fold pyridoxal phosphate-dependent enzyme [Bacteroidota bacterium]
MKFGIGYTFVQEFKKKHYDLKKFGNAFEKERMLLEETDLYCYDRFIEHSSDSKGNVGNSLNELKTKYIWCTNHYLGLNKHPEIINKTIEATNKYGTGSGTSAMSGGRCRLHIEIENFLKAYLSKSEAILFPTGYTTNLGMISTIVQKNDVIISDSENHASIMDGIKLSGKNSLMFKHNDIQSLENQLIKTKDKYKNKFVMVESAYSMSGDIAPLKKIIELRKKYNFFLYLDEAHTFGFYGKEGRGLASELGVLDEIDFMTGTFSKSCASIGGFCVFNEKFRTFITLRSSNYLFQATFPPSAAATILAAMKLFSSNSQYATSLHKKNNYMRKELLKHGFCLGNSLSPIIPIFISDIDKLTKFENEMYQKGIFAVSIIYPAVRPDEGRIRFIVTNSHTYEDIDKTVKILNQLAIKYKINDCNQIA